jgi:uncharacterized damage-inducible protein DinB
MYAPGFATGPLIPTDWRPSDHPDAVAMLRFRQPAFPQPLFSIFVMAPALLAYWHWRCWRSAGIQVRRRHDAAAAGDRGRGGGMALGGAGAVQAEPVGRGFGIPGDIPGRAWSSALRERTKGLGSEIAPGEPMLNATLPYRAMAYNNAWANHRLLAACARLSSSELTAPRTGFFQSVRATLNHILVIDRFYVDAMGHGSLGPAAWADREPCATIDALRLAQADVDRRLISVVERLDAAGLENIVSVHRGTHIQRERMDRLLLHLFQHQIHHRGQAHAMLSETSVPPPQLDEFFSAGEASLRAGELAELGWTEETIWGPQPANDGQSA